MLQSTRVPTMKTTPINLLKYTITALAILSGVWLFTRSHSPASGDGAADSIYPGGSARINEAGLPSWPESGRKIYGKTWRGRWPAIV
jgi:hypothetical protein